MHSTWNSRGPFNIFSVGVSRPESLVVKLLYCSHHSTVTSMPQLHTGPAALLPVETTTVFVSCRWRASASTSASSSCSPATAAPLNWHTWASYASLTCCAGVCVCVLALYFCSQMIQLLVSVTSTVLGGNSCLVVESVNMPVFLADAFIKKEEDEIPAGSV